MNRLILLAMIALLSAGCMQAKALPHMDELLTLKGYSDEKDAQRKWVDGQKQVFEQLLSAVKDGSIKNYPDQTAVAAQFGQPVVSAPSENEGRTLTRWLYRHPIQRLATDRVYLYFDPDGKLIKSEYVPVATTAK